MARYVFRLPDVGEGITEAEIAQWHVAVGDPVKEDQTLVDVMTDKATVDMTSPVSGTVVAIHGAVGERVAVGSNLVEFELDEERAEAPGAPVSQATPAPPPRQAQTPAGESQKAAPLAAPATRHRAKELGVSLTSVSGTGPEGRITPKDLEAHIAGSGTGGASFNQTEKRTGVKEIKIIGLRRKIAEKMLEAKRRIPHFTYVEELDLTELEGLRRELNETRKDEQPKLTLLPFFMRAIVRLVPEFPQVNARYDDEAGVLHAYEGVHIGIATQTADGLMVPVVRHAEALSLWQSARELSRVTAAARDGKATREELSGSTITLTSLGALGGISATPIINHPEVAIIGPNKLVERPVVVNGQIAIRTMMNLSSSFDHRIVDGYDAARFIQRMKQLLERPALLFIEAP